MNKSELSRFAVIGNPVAHSLSPYIHKSFAEQQGVELEYERIQATENSFVDIVNAFFAFGGKGLNITTPFKSLAADSVLSCSPIAKSSNSVNTLFLNEKGQLRGESTDGKGWLADIQRQNIFHDGMNILIIGAGGAARILINTLLAEPIQSLHIANRTVEKAEQLLGNKKVSASGLDNIPNNEWDLIINTLSVGWQGTYPKLNIQVTKATNAYDLNYGKGADAFNRWFVNLGGSSDHFFDGWGMLVEQAAESFNFWWGKKPSTLELIENGSISIKS